MPDLGVVGHTLFASAASHKTHITYGDSWQHLVDRYGFDCGDSYPSHGQEWCTPVKTMCCLSAEINRSHGEPLLASLCRRFDGRVGKGYVTAVRIRYGDAVANTLTTDRAIQAHADLERRLCWSFWERRW